MAATAQVVIIAGVRRATRLVEQPRNALAMAPYASARQHATIVNANQPFHSPPSRLCKFPSNNKANAPKSYRPAERRARIALIGPHARSILPGRGGPPLLPMACEVFSDFRQLAIHRVHAGPPVSRNR